MRAVAGAFNNIPVCCGDRGSQDFGDQRVGWKPRVSVADHDAVRVAYEQFRTHRQPVKVTRLV
jgi:hypothetical protein